MAAAPPAAPAFKNYEHACEALLKTVTLLEKDQEELQKLIAEAGDNQQMKMSKVIPQLQKTMGGALPEYGFPPPPAGILMAVMAFKNIADASTLGDDCPVKNGLAMLKDAMMGKTPSPEQIAAIKAGLEAQAK